MYEKILAGARIKRDWLLAALIAAALAVLLLVVLPLVSSMRLLYGFHRFTEDTAESFVYGERGECLTASFEGETWSVSTQGAGRLYDAIVRNGAGRPRTEMPETGGLCLDFGDGSALWLFPVPFDGAARENDTGVLLWYARADGTHYAYDTDGLQMEDVLRFVR